MATRRERVVLELEDQFTAGMVRATASTALLKRELGSLSGDSVKTQKATRDLNQELDNTTKSAKNSTKEIDNLSGRMSILRDVAILLGPTLAPIGAVAAAGIAGVSSELGFAAVGAGVAMLAFHGLGDALTALDKATLHPTTANLDALHATLANLSPAARGLVTEIHSLLPGLHDLQNVAQTNMFPGVIEGLKSLESTFPRVEKLIAAVSAELGGIAGQAGGSLASDRWAPFLDFLTKEAPIALGDMAKSIGNVTHALAELWMATGPLNRDFSTFLVNSTADLDRWATGLSQTQGFHDFMEYVRTEGPQLEHTIGAIANAFLQIVEAAAPLAGPTLKALEGIANAIAAIAKSDAGTPIYAAVAAYVVFNRTVAISISLLEKLGFAQTATSAKAAASGDKFGTFTKGLALATAGLIAFNAADSALHLSASSSDIFRMTSLLDAKAGPNVGDQIAATKAAIAAQQKIVDSADFHIPLGITDIYSSDKAAKAADVVRGLKSHLADLNNQEQINKATSASYTLEIQRQNEALTASRAAATTAARQFVDFDSTLNDAKVSLDQWTRRLAQQASALEHFATNAETAGRRGLRDGLIKELRAAGPEGALRMKQLADGTDAQIRRANRAWLAGQQAVRDYTNAVGGVPKPKLDVDTSAATTKLKNLGDLLQSVMGPALAGLPNVKTPHHTSPPKLPPGMTAGAHADGGYMSGPGGPRDDLIPVWLSNGEYVMPADTVSHYGLSTMEAMRAKRLAGGGPVDPTPDSVLTSLYGGSGSGGSKAKGSGSSAGKGGPGPTWFVDWANLHKALLGLTGASNESAAGLKSSLVSTKKELASLTASLSALQQASSSLRSSVTSGFTTDVLSSSYNPFSNDPTFAALTPAMQQQMIQAAGLNQVGNDATQAQSFAAAIADLKRKGAHGGLRSSGAFLSALASSNNLDAATFYDSLSSSQLKSVTSAYTQRAQSVSAAGSSVASTVYANGAATVAEIKALRQEVKLLTAVTKGITGHHAQQSQATLTGAAVGAQIKSALGTSAVQKAAVKAATNPRGRT